MKNDSDGGDNSPRTAVVTVTEYGRSPEAPESPPAASSRLVATRQTAPRALAAATGRPGSARVSWTPPARSASTGDLEKTAGARSSCAASAAAIETHAGLSQRRTEPSRSIQGAADAAAVSSDCREVGLDSPARV